MFSSGICSSSARRRRKSNCTRAKTVNTGLEFYSTPRCSHCPHRNLPESPSGVCGAGVQLYNGVWVSGGLQEELWAHLEVTLKSVEDERLFPVELPLHFQRQAADGWLEVRLLRVHHEPYPVLHGVLEHRFRFNYQSAIYIMSSFGFSMKYSVEHRCVSAHNLL